MTYLDEIVDEVRAIRESICTQAGSLDNLLFMLRSGEAANVGRIVKHPGASGRGELVVAGASRLYKDKMDKALCAEADEKYRTKKSGRARK